MINPNVIYIAVAMVFIYIVAKFKLIPYLAARKILKDSKKNGTKQEADTAVPSPAPALPSGFPVAFQSLLAQPQPPATPEPDRRDMYFDYCVIAVPPSTGTDDHDSLDVCGSKIESEVSQFLLGLRKHCICPASLDIVRICDGLLLAYVTYMV